MAQSIASSLKLSASGLFLLGALASMGCQSNYSGQTLPSPYWLQDDVQYFPPGTEFKLSHEATAMKTYGGARRDRVGPVGPQESGPVPGAPAPGDVPNGGVGAGGVPGAPIPGAPIPGNIGPGGPVDAAPENENPADAPPAEGAADDPFNPK
ncbi:MAG TPA: hypothetical protein VGJ26_12565 [Pirellulales bacterium]